MRVGRNDPCPCGSGKKYKKCCLAGAGPDKVTPHTELALRGLHKAMAGETFNSLEEIQSFTDSHFQQQNQAPLKDFLGLSSEEMFRFLHHPFDSPNLISFPALLDEPPEAPIMTLFNLMVEAIGDEGMKATAKGNLPRKFVREAALVYWGEEKYQERTKRRGVNREDDLAVLTTARLIAKLAGLVLLRKQKFVLTRKCRDLMAKHGPGGVYPLLFNAYAQKFNWAYLDGFPDFHIIQQSFAFTLWVLSRYGDVGRPPDFYEEIFLRAFPRMINEVDEDDILPPKRMARLSFTLRALRQFVRLMGLGTTEQVGKRGLYEPVYEVKKLPLLDQVIQFYLPDRIWPSVDDFGRGGNRSERAGTNGRAMAPAEKGGPVSKGMAYQIKVTLRDTEPAIWRRILIADDATFWDLHVAIQDAMGWTDTHLHEFEVKSSDPNRMDHVGIPSDDFDAVDAIQPGWEVPLSNHFTAPGHQVLYLYDFGDNWEHTVLLEQMVPTESGGQYPSCLDGRRKCPPEDCGGAGRYEEFLKVIGDRGHPEHEAMLEWVGGSFDPDEFDPRAVVFDAPQERLEELLEGM